MSRDDWSQPVRIQPHISLVETLTHLHFFIPYLPFFSFVNKQTSSSITARSPLARDSIGSDMHEMRSDQPERRSSTTYKPQFGKHTHIFLYVLHMEVDKSWSINPYAGANSSFAPHGALHERA